MQETTNRSALDRIMAMVSEQEADTLGTAEEAYSIERGKPGAPDESLEAQARRATHHLQRISQADNLRTLRDKGLRETIAYAQGMIAQAERELQDSEYQFLQDTRPDRYLLADWYATARQFNEPGRPRAKTFDLGAGQLREHRKTTPARVVLINEQEAAEAFPGHVEYRPKLRWGDLQKTLQIAPDGSVIAPGGVVLPRSMISSLPRHSEDVLEAVVNGHRIDLKGGVDNGSGDDGPDSEPKPEPEPGDDAEGDVFGDL
ncbi:MAG: hypothetical protein ABFE07_24280 [Armatimonadia bacterium]